MHRKSLRLRTRLVLLLAAVATIAAGASALIPAGAGATTNTLAAHTAMTNRDDSSAQGGNWAVDDFTRGVQIFFKGSASSSNCGGTSPCYSYTGKVSDTGHFTTVVGQKSPGFGYLNGNPDPTMAVAVTGAMTGSQTYAFFTTVPVSGASASNVPASNAGDNYNSGEWPELFFPAGTQFWNSAGASQGTLTVPSGGELGTGFFTYTYNAKAGSNHDCPNMTSQWKDASPDSGSAPSSGNILAPDASGC
jgi:hypothetical protein